MWIELILPKKRILRIKIISRTIMIIPVEKNLKNKRKDFNQMPNDFVKIKFEIALK